LVENTSTTKLNILIEKFDATEITVENSLNEPSTTRRHPGLPPTQKHRRVDGVHRHTSTGADAWVVNTIPTGC
jgi:hypothetical protein